MHEATRRSELPRRSRVNEGETGATHRHPSTISCYIMAAIYRRGRIKLVPARLVAVVVLCASVCVRVCLGGAYFDSERAPAKSPGSSCARRPRVRQDRFALSAIQGGRRRSLLSEGAKCSTAMPILRERKRLAETKNNNEPLLCAAQEERTSRKKEMAPSHNDAKKVRPACRKKIK